MKQEEEVPRGSSDYHRHSSSVGNMLDQAVVVEDNNININNNTQLNNNKNKKKNKKNKKKNASTGSTGTDVVDGDGFSHHQKNRNNFQQNGSLLSSSSSLSLGIQDREQQKILTTEEENNEIINVKSSLKPPSSSSLLISSSSSSSSRLIEYLRIYLTRTKTTIMENCCLPFIKEPVDADRIISRNIDRDIKKAKREKSKVIELLLLGAGESGKTTIIKQMKILHIQGFNDSERSSKAREIRENVFDAITELASNMEYLKPPLKIENPENNDSYDYVKKLDRTSMHSFHFPMEFFQHAKRLWSDPGIQACYLRSNEFSLIDSAKYFLNKIDEIKEPDYLPSNQDILHSRSRTSRVQLIEFKVKVPRQYGGGMQPFSMFDVGGQRGERRKWFQMFEGITAILFVVDSSGFDTKLREDGITNRLMESLDIFRSLVQSKFLVDAGIILFLNKQDILKDKIERGHRIADTFPEYNQYQLSKKDGDPNDEYNRVRCFIRDKFLAISQEGIGKNRSCFSHFTTATDTDNIERVFNDVHTMFLINTLNVIA